MATGMRLHQFDERQDDIEQSVLDAPERTIPTDKAVFVQQAWLRMVTAQRRLLDERNEPRNTARQRSDWHLMMTEALIAHSRFIQLVREAPE